MLIGAAESDGTGTALLLAAGCIVGCTAGCIDGCNMGGGDGWITGDMVENPVTVALPRTSTVPLQFELE